MKIIKTKFQPFLNAAGRRLQANFTLNPKGVEVKKKNLACFVYSKAINKRTLIYSEAVNQTLYPLFTKEKVINKSIKHVKVKKEEYDLETFKRSNQDTCLIHKPSVIEGNWVQSGDLLTDCASSMGGELSLGQNLLIAYMPWEGYNFEDAILISERLVIDDLYTSVHIERYELETQQTKLGSEEITRHIPDVSEKELSNLDSFGIVKKGSWVEEGDILVGKITPINKKKISPYQKLLYTILEKQVRPIKDSSLRAPKGIKAKVIDIKYFLKTSNYLRLPLSTVDLEKQKKTAPLPFLKKEKGSIKKTKKILYKKINFRLKKDHNDKLKKVRDMNSLNLLLSYEQGLQGKGKKTTIFFNKLNKIFSRNNYYKQTKEIFLYSKDKEIKYINSYNLTGFSKLSDSYLFENKMNLIFTYGCKNKILANRFITFNSHKLLPGKSVIKWQDSFFDTLHTYIEKKIGLQPATGRRLTNFAHETNSQEGSFVSKKNNLSDNFVFESAIRSKVNTKGINFIGGFNQKQTLADNLKNLNMNPFFIQNKDENLQNSFFLFFKLFRYGLDIYINSLISEALEARFASFVILFWFSFFIIKKPIIFALKKKQINRVAVVFASATPAKVNTFGINFSGGFMQKQKVREKYLKDQKRKQIDINYPKSKNLLNLYFINYLNKPEKKNVTSFVPIYFKKFLPAFHLKKEYVSLLASLIMKDVYLFLTKTLLLKRNTNNLSKLVKETLKKEKQFAIQNFISLAYSKLKKMLQNKKKNKDNFIFFKQKVNKYKKKNRFVFASQKQEFDENILASLKQKNKDNFVSSKLTKFGLLIAKIPFWQNVFSIFYQKNKQELPTSWSFINGHNIIKKQKIGLLPAAAGRRQQIETHKTKSQSFILPYSISNSPLTEVKQRAYLVDSEAVNQIWKSKTDIKGTNETPTFGICLVKKTILLDPEKLHKKATLLKNIEKIAIYLAEKRKIQVGDKMAGRHGNKGIVSKILPIQDMPFLPDGTSIDMVLNPLGVPSRMNVGQIYECLLGLAGKFLGENYKITCFDEIFGPEASRSFVFNKLYEARIKTGLKWLFDPNSPGKIRIYDGRNGECFDQKITVGQAYILRLVHMVDDKIHMRSTGPYSLVTQQPLRGRSKQGGQRLGEMEVWALEGYGAAFTLLEMLTIKSDDMTGRMTLWSKLILNKDISIGTPESFKVLICELQALCLDIGLFRYNDLNKEPSHFITGKAVNKTGGFFYKNNLNNLREITNLINLP